MLNSTTPGDDKALITRAIAAHYRAANVASTEPRHPTGASHVTDLAGRRYVVLVNGTGLISIYRVHNNGALRYMRRPPKELLATEGRT